MIDLSKYISATQAGERLGISRVRVVQLIDGGRLPAVKAGRDWLIDPADLKLVKDRPVGRPVGSKKAKKSAKG
jgi:excisionase family DNA binding protein